ncbi:MAG: HAD family hydrolase [Verrucomicrobiaceae bacterium]
MSPVHHVGSWKELQAWLLQETTVQVIICDVYGTLLEVRPGSTEAAARWKVLWRRLLPEHPIIPLEDIDRKMQQGIAVSHAASKDPFPEVDWVALFSEIVPHFAARLARHHARLQRECVLMPRVAEFLRGIHLPLGICSNAQAYTLMELRLALRAHRLSLGVFDPAFTFWSFQHGTAKPNPAIFVQLARRATLDPSQFLMVGDRRDNDIQPAMEAGWSTWQLLS